MAYLIDDRYAAAATPQMCALDGLILALTATALGTFFSSKKADWLPKQAQRFLGIEVDSKLGAFRVPTDKQEHFLATVDAMLGSDTVTARQLAHLAGLIVSMSMAVNLCPMFTRRLFLAIVGMDSWDSLFPTPTTVRDELTWWKANFHKAEGRQWPTIRDTVVAVGDASETHAGAFFPEGHLSHPLQVALPHHLRGASSIARELFAVQAVLQTFVRHAPNAVRSKRLLYHTDSQATTYCVAKQKGVNECLGVVRNIHLLAWQYDVELDLVWANREDPWQAQADFFSKATDLHDWGFLEAAVQWICRQLEVPYSAITLDAFATASTAVCSRFIARYYDPRALAVDAFSRTWNQSPGCYAWVNPPPRLVGRTLQHLSHNWCRAVVVLPTASRAWEPLIADLPKLRGPLILPRAITWKGVEVNPWFHWGPSAAPEQRPAHWYPWVRVYVTDP